MKEGRPSAGDYIASLLSSSPRLDFGGEEEEEDCLDRFCGDPGFAARAARLSSFSGQRFAVTAGLFGLPPPLPAASGGGEFAGSREASSVSDPASAMKDANAKKRKAPAAAAAKGKGREPSAQVRVVSVSVSILRCSNCFCRGPRLRSRVWRRHRHRPRAVSVQAQAGEPKGPDAKRCCKAEGGEGEEGSPVKLPKPEQAGSDSSVEDGGAQNQKPPPPVKGKNAKPVEPPRDYVHVRARRGQATDSHSLAERVR
jgi:hypothetical protein